MQVERLPLEESDEPPGEGARRGRGDPFRGSFGPLLAGILIDLADFLTPLGLGAKLGVPVGALVGYLLGVRLGLTLRQRLILAAVGAAYCSLHGTRLLPLGTLVGALLRVRPRGA